MHVMAVTGCASHARRSSRDLGGFQKLSDGSRSSRQSDQRGLLLIPLPPKTWSSSASRVLMAAMRLEVDVVPSMPKNDSFSSVSPSSTMDDLPTQSNPAVHRRIHAATEHHTLEICKDGVVRAHGGSAMCEEGDTFIAHLGIGCEWGSPIDVAREVALPSTAACLEVAAGRLHSLFLCDAGAVYSVGGGWEGVLGHGDEACHAAYNKADHDP